MNFLESFKKYLLSLKNPASHVTVKNYLADIRKFISWFENTSHAQFNPKQITTTTIADFKAAQSSASSPRSVERYISSLRKFFDFLKLEGHLGENPFDYEASHTPQPVDTWHLKAFKNFLYVYNSSALTIKNYIIDIRQFFLWAQEVLNVCDDQILENITTELIESYKERLYSEKVFSASSINRKLSSLRKYLAWAQQQNLLGNMSESITPISQPITVEKILASVDTVGFIPEKIATTPSTSHVSYSKFPPFRLFQKASRGVIFTTETVVIAPLATLIEKGLYTLWKVKGKKIFNQSDRPIQKGFVPKIQAFSNIPKSVFAPLSLSLEGLPLQKKIWFYLKFKRPNWYKKYHEYAIAHYFHWAVLFIFTAIIGFGLYSSFVKSSSPTLAAPVSPLRILSFQGRLTDNSDNPITTGKNLRFIVYNDLSASGSARLWEEVDYVTPDSDGIFSLLLGSNGSGGNAALCNSGNPPSSPATGACGIPQSLFANNATLYMGVTVENLSELTPRQQIATVAYATNAEVLQGMPPTTDSSVTTNANTVLALNSSGVVSISGSSTATTIQYTGNQFNLIGKVLSLQTASGTNTNVQVIPDGKGLIDLQKPLQNSTLNSNIVSGVNGASTSAGAVEVDDLFAVLATSSGQSAFTINQDGLGPVISASKSGIAVFTVDGSGNETISGNLSLPNANTLTGVSNFVQFNNGVSVGGGTTYFINTTTSSLNSLQIAGNIYQPVASGVNGPWQYASNVIAPANTINDLAIGGAATSSAKFQIFGATGNATTSGTLTFDTAGNIQTTRAQNLTIGGANTGQVILNGLNSSGTGITFAGYGTGVLHSSSTGVISSSAVSLTADVTGILPLANGGTNNNLTANNGGIVYSDASKLQILNGTVTAGQCLVSGSNAAPSWATCSSGGAGTNYWTLAPLGGALTPINETLDILAGGDATSSAKFAVLNLAAGTPVASISAQNASNQALVLSSGETIQTVRMHNLTIGGNQTGNITLNPLNGGGTITFTGYGNGIIRSTSGLLSASTVSLNAGSSDITGTLSTDNGGTGLTTGSLVAGDLPYYATGTAFSRLGIGAANTVLTSTGTAPQWSTSLTLAGNLQVNGNTTLGDTAGDTLTVNALLNQALLPTAGGTINLGSVAQPFNNVYANNFIGTGGAGTFGFWTLSNNVIYPTATYYDLAVGGTSTGSATPWQVFASNVGVATAGTATSSGNLTFRGTSTDIKLLNGGSLNIKSSVGGDVSTTTIFGLTNQGAISLGGTNPTITATATNSTLGIAANGAGTLTLNGGATGAVQFFSASNKIDNSGNLTLAGTITLPNSNTLTGVAGFVQFNNGVSVGGGTTYFINATTSSLNSLQLAGNLYQPVASGVSGPWQYASNVIAPANTINDLAIGGAATSSAAWQVFGETIAANSAVAGTATSSGNLAFRGASTRVDLLNNATLGVYNSVGGNIGLGANPALYVANSGNVGIGTASPLTALNIVGSASESANFTFYNSSNGVTHNISYLNDGALNFLRSTGGDSTTTSTLFLDKNGNVGIGSTSPLATLDLRGNAYTTPVASISGATGKATLVLDQSGVGDIFSASQSGGARFTIANDGSIRNSLIPNLDQTYDLGNPSRRWNNLYVQNIFTPASGGTSGFWSLSNNVIYPANIWQDLAVGGTATGSATPWQVFGSSVGVAVAGTATSSGNLTFRGSATTIDQLNGGTLNFRTSVGGDTGLTSRLFITNGGNVGIGTTNPLALLDIAGNASISGNLTFSGANRIIAASALNNLILGNSSTSNLYFNPSNASIFGSSTTLIPLSQTAVQISKNGLGNSIAVIDQLGLGDIFTASASGVTEFKLTNAGNVHARQFVDLDNANYFLDPAATGTSLTTAGSAAIGTTSATQKLTVIGDAQIGYDAIAWGGSLNGYAFRKQILLQNNAASPSGTLSNYQQRIVINTAALISASKMRSDCGDIRFTDEDGTTNLSYWLEAGCNTGETTFWVKVPTIPGGQQKLIYMYYSSAGASGASSTSIVTDTISSVKASWRMDDYDPNSLNDASGNLNYASTSANVITVNGKFNYAKQFNGSSSYIEVPDSTSLRLSNTYSLSVWIKTTQTSTGNILRKDTTTGTRFLYAIRINDTTTCAANKVEFQFYNGTTNNYACSTSNINDGAWHHVVGIMNASNQMGLYFDGVQEAAFANIGAGGVGSPTGSLDIGATPPIPAGSRTDFFTGTIDDIIITNTVLSSSQIANLYGLGIGGINGKNIAYMSAYPATAGDLYIMAYAQNPPVPVFMQEENVARILPSFYVQATTGNIGIGTNQVATSSARLTVAGDVKAGLYDVTTWGSNFNGYQFRSKITVDNTASSSAMSNYQAQVNVNTIALINAGKMRSDCGDMRFADSDGNTALNYWIETASGSATTCNNVNTTTWVKIPSIQGSAKKFIYMYYGNPTSTTTSSGANTFDFFDDFTTFDTATIWSKTGSAFLTNNNTALAVNTGAVYTQATKFSQPGEVLEAKVLWKNSVANNGITMTSNQNCGSGNVICSTYLQTGGTAIGLWANNNNTSVWNTSNGNTQFTSILNVPYIISEAVGKNELYTYLNRVALNNYASNVQNTNYSATQFVVLGTNTGSGAGTTDVSDAVYEWVIGRQFSTVPPTITIGTEQDPSQVDPVIYASTVSQNVGINTANPLATLDIEGTTSNTNGMAYIGGTMNIPSHALTVATTFTQLSNTATFAGIETAPVFTPVGPWGMLGGGLAGMRAEPSFMGTGTLGSLFGFNDLPANNNTGTITSMYGNYIQLRNNSTGTISNAYGTYIAAPVNNGTITTSFSLYAETGAGSAAIFDGLGIGTTLGNTKLTVFSSTQALFTALAGFTMGNSGTNEEYGIYLALNETAQANKYFILAQSDCTTACNNRFFIRSNGSGAIDGVWVSGADFAEYFYVKNADLEPGDVASLSDDQVRNSNQDILMGTAEGADDKKIPLGVVSTKPGYIGALARDVTASSSSFGSDPHYRSIGLLGQLPVKVTTANGMIHGGDMISTSPLKKFGAKATSNSKYILGKATEDFVANDTVCSPIQSLDDAVWPFDPNNQDGGNEHKVCYKLPDGTYVGKVMMYVHVLPYDSATELADTNSLSLGQNQQGDFILSTQFGEIIKKIGAFGKLISASIQTGLLQAQKITTQEFAVTTNNVTIAGQHINDYIIGVVQTAINNGTLGQIGNGHVISPLASTEHLKTNVISPIADDSSIALKLDKNKISVFNDKDASGSAVTSFDNIGNATFSGTLNSDKLAVNSDATVSGTLYANKIVADQIEGLDAKVGTLSAQNITNVTNIYFASSSATGQSSGTDSGSLLAGNQYNGMPGPEGHQPLAEGGFVDVASFSAYLAYVPELQTRTATVMQNFTAYGNTTLSDTTIAGTLAIGGQMIFTNTSINVLGEDLQLQPLRQGGIAFAGGQIRIDQDGNLNVNGKAVFHDTLAAKIISPLTGQDLTINLPDRHPELVSGSPSDHITKLNVTNASGSAILSLDNTGELIASGAGTFAKLNLSLVQPAYAISTTEVVASGSAGTTQINTHQKEVTLDNKLVTNKSLIYITPVGDTGGQVPVLLRQVPGESFTVGVSTFTISPIQFNWLIVN